MNVLVEDSRNSLVAKSKQSQKGLQRYKRRLKSKVSNSTAEFNKIDMNNLFKQNILVVSIKVHGETDDYLVKISFGGFLDALYNELKKNDVFDLRTIIRALIYCFNNEDVYISCSCADWRFRYGYWATKNNITSGDPENIPSDITNPNDSLGSACKHVLLVLSNTSWLIKVASVIKNYVEYIEKHRPQLYADIIYPAIYKKKYEKPVQQELDYTGDLDSKESDIDTANKAARQKGKFTSDNPYKYQKSDISKDQVTLEDEVIDEQ